MITTPFFFSLFLFPTHTEYEEVVYPRASLENNVLYTKRESYWFKSPGKPGKGNQRVKER